MRRLMLLRHAKSDWSRLGARDHDRSLAERGRDAAPRIGAYMATHALVPAHVICSTARRTRETWALIAKSLPSEPPVVYSDRLYDASPQAIFEAIRDTADGLIHTLLVIGHNPGLKEFAEYMIASGDLEARQQLAEKLPTAGLVVIDFAVDSWTDLHPRSGRLDRFITPGALNTAAD
jgi:phosphohistidine phosphatase